MTGLADDPHRGYPCPDVLLPLLVRPEPWTIQPEMHTPKAPGSTCFRGRAARWGCPYTFPDLTLALAPALSFAFRERCEDPLTS